MNRRHVIKLLGTMAASSPLARATSSLHTYPRTERFLKSLVETGQCNGNIGCIYRNGQMELDRPEGWMDADHTIPMRHDAIFSMASMSKPITGVSTMILVDQGRIKLDDPIDKWIPELANRRVLLDPSGPLNNTYASPRPITVSDLLGFRMGLGISGGPRGPITDALNKANPLVPIMETMTWEDWLQGMATLPLQYAPGDRWLYNTSADVLTALIYRVTGAQPHVFMEQNLFGPLGMKDTSFMPSPKAANRIAGWPAGFTRQYVSMTPRLESGAAGTYSTASDYMAFAEMLLNGGVYRGKRILASKSLDLMTVNRLNAEDMKNGVFAQTLPGWGYGYTMAVRLTRMDNGPSVGSFNWDGASGVWFMIDPKNNMASLLMIQHPKPDSPGFTDQKDAAKFLTLKQLHEGLSTAIYTDLASA